jgi:hypothetical protein
MDCTVGWEDEERINLAYDTYKLGVIVKMTIKN